MKMQRLVFCLLLCWSISASLSHVQATTDKNLQVDTTDIMSLSIEELLEVPITTVASLREEKVTDAPGIIKVHSSKNIETYGYYSLHELAQITPGYFSQSRYDLGGFTVRGLSAGGWDNNKVLLLVDEIPITMARNYHAWAEEELPLFFADRVEFLRGPASALYGTGAFLGVINITSKSTEEGESLFETRMTGGDSPYNARRLMANMVTNKNGLEGRLFLGYYNKDARRNVYMDSTQLLGYTAGPHYSENYDDSRHLFVNTSVTVTNEDSWFRGFTPGFILLERRGGLGTGWEGFTHQVNDITYRSYIPYLKFKRSLSEDLMVNAYAKYQHYNEEGVWAYRGKFMADSFPTTTDDILHSYRVVVPNFETKVDFTYQISEGFDAVVGAYYDVRYEKGLPDEFIYLLHPNPPFYTIDPTHAEDSEKFKTNSYYAQLRKDFDVLEGLGVTIGGRYDIGETYEQFSPRAGFVQHITQNIDLKALYGSALKAPGIKEYGYNSEPQHLGEPGDIDPETIKTYEVSLIWTDPKLSASATYFNNKIEDPIARIANISETTVFGNDEGTFESNGVELEGDWAFIAGGRMFANVTLFESKDDEGVEIPLVPAWTGNLGVAYTVEPIDLTVASVVKFTGDYHPQGEGEDLEGATIWDINLIKAINKNAAVELQVKNVLDEEYYHPGEDSWEAFDYLQPGRTILGTLSIRF